MEDPSKLTEAFKAGFAAAERLTMGGVPDVRVWRWFREARQWPIFFAGIVLFFFLILKVVAGLGLGPFAEPEHKCWSKIVFSFAVVDYVEAFVLAVLLAYVVAKGRRDESVKLSRETKSIKEEQFRSAVRAENRFFLYWPMLLVVWFLFYVAFGVGAILGLVPEPELCGCFQPQNWPIAAQNLSAVALSCLNNLTCIPFLGMYYELAEKPADRDDPDVTRLWITLAVILFVIVAVVEGNLIASTPYSEEVTKWAPLLSGLLVGVCSGLFVSKLTSRLFDLPILTLLLLTLYVVVQAAFSAISSPDLEMQTIRYVLVLIALYTKYVLLVVIEWKRDEYRILYFIYQSLSRKFVNRCKAFVA